MTYNLSAFMPYQEPASSSVGLQLCNLLCLAEEAFRCATCAKNHHYLQCVSGNWSCL